MNAHLLCIVSVLGLSSLASSQVLASDDFNYTGALTANGWVAHSGAGVKQIMANGSAATLNQSSGAGEDIHLPFMAQSSTDVTFAAIDMNVPSGNPVNPSSEGLYFLHLKDAGFTFRARVGLLTAAGSGDFALAINSDLANLSGGTSWASDLNFDTTYRVVISWDANSGISEMWVNPVNVNSTSVTQVGLFGGGALVSAVALRQADTYTGFITVGNIVAGKTFDDVLVSELNNTGAAACEGSTGLCPCFTVGAADHGCPNSNSSNGAKLVGSGNASILGDSFGLSVTDASANKAGVVLSGTADLSPGVNTVSDSAGLLCVGGFTLRGAVVFTDANGDASLPNFQGAAYGMAGNVSAYMLSSYQYWYRDPGTACAPNDTPLSDFNFSNAWVVTWLP